MPKLGVERYRQWNGYSCGPKSLFMITEYHDIDVTYSEVARLCKLDEDGTWDADLIAAARKLGFTAQSRKKDLLGVIHKEISNGWPLVAVRTDLPGYPEGHFCVISGIDGNKLYIKDPSIRGSSTIAAWRIPEVIYSVVCLHCEFEEEDEEYYSERNVK